MNIQALKYEIIEWITRTNDNSLLKTLKSIKDSNAATTDWFDNLSQEEKESLNRGISEHDKGDVLTSKEFWTGYGDKV
ncbi:hypothetical protein [Cesiribacter andamanensis]|uniref:Addiction module component n=1 Tax=Cesiribacter andamanensis AMV16 TaxID=1279009 RepID=M7NZY0_9BACT|nr:hypothetical protein [Cesiribacter andamanensis]EMR03924.1 hypothetical protein ADICEAN_00891 [Cesiribacter andamanensis AMV16]